MAYAITLQADAVSLRTRPSSATANCWRAGPNWIERISRRDLAAYLAVTDVALSRIAKRVSTDAPESWSADRPGSTVAGRRGTRRRPGSLGKPRCGGVLDLLAGEAEQEQDGVEVGAG